MTTSAIIVSTNKQDQPLRPERIYVGIDLGYREHVAAAIPLAAFNPQHRSEGWKRVKTLKFTSDASGYQRLKRYLDRLSVDSADFLVLLEPTGGYYGLSLILFLPRQRLSRAPGRQPNRHGVPREGLLRLRDQDG